MKDTDDKQGEFIPSSVVEEDEQPVEEALNADVDIDSTQFDDSVRDVSYHPGLVVLYSPPMQRQRWEDSQILPRINWGDTFFDLFFVAAAYNVGNILVLSPSGHGFLYFVTCFFVALTMWRDKTYFDARIVVGDDLSHRLIEALLYVVVAFGIVHINPVEIMSNPRKFPDMFAFSMVATIFTIMSVVVYLEVYFFGVGQRDILKQAALREIKVRIVSILLQLAAVAVSGVEYFVHGAETRSGYGKEVGNYRMLATNQDEVSSTSYVNNIPIYLLLGAFLSQWIIFMISIQFFLPSDGSHKKFTIPLNIAFVIHRDGDWTMLMFGESIMSLLIVDVSEGDKYYVAFFSGILTIVLLQYLHYKSQPHDPDFHASRRHKDAGIWWSTINSIYAASLVAVGVSYKLFMYEFTYAGRRLQEEEGANSQRTLAGSSGYSLSDYDRQHAAANVFSAAMALVFLCLDLMLLFHRGLTVSFERCQSAEKKGINTSVLLLTITRVALVLFFATLSQYANDPTSLSVLGFVGVLIQLIIRRLGYVFFHSREKRKGCDAKEPEALMDGNATEECRDAIINPNEENPQG